TESLVPYPTISRSRPYNGTNGADCSHRSPPSRFKKPSQDAECRHDAHDGKWRTEERRGEHHRTHEKCPYAHQQRAEMRCEGGSCVLLEGAKNHRHGFTSVGDR